MGCLDEAKDALGKARQKLEDAVDPLDAKNDAMPLEFPGRLSGYGHGTSRRRRS